MLELYSAAIYALSARVDVPLPGYAKSRLFLELYATDANPLPEPGSYDLSVAPDDDYATCERCVLLVAYDEADQPRRVFFQQSGSFELSLFGADQFHVAAGEASDVRLVELSQNENGSWNVVPGGLCFDVPAWTFDTQPVHGGPCVSAEDCPNEVDQICDVETKTCQPSECNLFFDPPFCDADQVCMSQYGPLVDHDESGSAMGACYPTCTPGPAGTQGDCEAGATCFPLDPIQTFGMCLATGGPEVGEACDPTDVSTGCAAGALCAGEPPTCHAICDYLTVDNDCPSGTYCSILNLCEPLAAGDDAPVGALCDATAPFLADCGPEGDAFRGLCFATFDEAASCRRVCKTADPQCPGGLSCIATFSNPDVGLCMDVGICGDGALDLYGGEYCDDGNVASGDGCSGDCTSAELGPLCAAPTPLSPGFPVFGINDGVNGWMSSCDPFLAMPVRTYAFMPPAPGELRLDLTSLSELGISVLADCHDPNSELSCRNHPGDDTVHVNFTSVPSQPALVVVRGANPLQSGLFILQSAFYEASCGDGYLSGPEACDDGNIQGGDGCSADCSAIEWPELCASLPELAIGSSLSSLDDAPSFWDTTGSCSYESGRDRAFRFVAPSAGTLTVSVSSPDNLSVVVQDGCGPANETPSLACSNFAPAGDTEQTSVTLAQGQAVTVVVDAFTKADAGPFTLTAIFAP